MKKSEGKRTRRGLRDWWEDIIKVTIWSSLVECIDKKSEGKRTLRGPSV